jgi:hypothetical protein
MEGSTDNDDRVFKKIRGNGHPDNVEEDAADMSQLNFGAYVLDSQYRQSMPPFYTAAMVVWTYLGHNIDHPGQKEWMEMDAEKSSTTASDDDDADWKLDTDDGNSSNASSSDSYCSSTDYDSDDSGRDVVNPCTTVDTVEDVVNPCTAVDTVEDVVNPCTTVVNPCTAVDTVEDVVNPCTAVEAVEDAATDATCPKCYPWEEPRCNSPDVSHCYSYPDCN